MAPFGDSVKLNYSYFCCCSLEVVFSLKLHLFSVCVYVCMCVHMCVGGAFAHVCMYRGQKVLPDVFLYWSLPIYLFIPLFTYFFLSQVLQKLNSPVCLQWLYRALPVSDPAIFQLWGSQVCIALLMLAWVLVIQTQKCVQQVLSPLSNRPWLPWLCHKIYKVKCIRFQRKPVV